ISLSYPTPAAFPRPRTTPNERPPAPAPLPVPVADAPPGVSERGRDRGLAERVRRPLASGALARWRKSPARRLRVRPRTTDARPGLRDARVAAAVFARRLAGPRARQRGAQAARGHGSRGDHSRDDRGRPRGRSVGRRPRTFRIAGTAGAPGPADRK